LEPELMYATVHKERKNGRAIKVEQRIILGKEERTPAMAVELKDHKWSREELLTCHVCDN